ncbi:hypothetical protein B0H17DRAFT_1200443 [Mycena rosella]|uniref:Uncharacterized protein n=1 Tax=Mycena rosella TaxID=1033263 RepID=A0AAD7DJD9_MYCRO|nr:hypothetical protein B0H17DRAFT_1200443 [Mycena rosella]
MSRSVQGDVALSFTPSSPTPAAIEAATPTTNADPAPLLPTSSQFGFSTAASSTAVTSPISGLDKPETSASYKPSLSALIAGPILAVGTIGVAGFILFTICGCRHRREDKSAEP